MATSFTRLTPNANDPTSKSMENEAKPAAMEIVKSNKGRKPSGKGPYQKRQPRRGMGMAKLEHARERLIMEEMYKMMSTTGTTLTTATATATATATTTTTQFPCTPVGTSTCNVPVLHGVASYGVPVMIDGGLCGWGHPATGLVLQRVAAAGSVGGLMNGQVLVGAPARSSFHQGVVVEASKELSSLPKLKPQQQHCNPDHCDVCFKKIKHWNVENARLNGGYNQFGQVFPVKGSDFHGLKKLERKENFNGDQLVNGLKGTARAARRSTASFYAGQMNINEAVDVVAIHKKESSMGSIGSNVVKEYEFFPGISSRSTPSKEWEMPQEASVAVGGEASYANASNCIDLSLKLS